ncbi:MAG: SDR family NAD(P)-dependent oxidoreductase, partial [Calditrichia bacterium]|nr:SDR family NAD(P)-dependent oxidoreductase [Calditrichia bacterium]
MEKKILLYISIFIGSFLISQLIAKIWIPFAYKRKIVSKGAARDIHTKMTPTLGGITFIIPILIAFLFSGLMAKFGLLTSVLFTAGFLVILSIGVLDDILGLSPTVKLISQTIGVLLIVFSGMFINSLILPIGQPIYIGIFGIIFSFLLILLTINAFNFIDGLDGLAGGISFIIISALTYIAFSSGNFYIVIINLAALGALSGFLRLNFYPAKLFMGDTGSLFLGLLTALESIHLFSQNTNSIKILPVVILLFLPVGDALLAFFRRLHAGLSPFHADKKHIHHRLLEIGFSYNETVWSLNSLNILFAILAITIYNFHNSISILLLICFSALILFAVIRMGYFNLYQQTIIIFPRNKPYSSNDDITPVPINLKHLWHKIVILFSDIVLLNVSLYLTYLWKISNYSVEELHSLTLDLPVFLLLSFSWILLFFLNNLYDMPWDVSLFYKMVKVSRIIWFGIVFIGIITFDIDSGLTTSQIKSLFVYGLTLTFFINFGRLLLNLVEQKLKIWEYSYKKTLLIGSDNSAANLIKDCDKNSSLLYDIVGIIQKQPKKRTFHGFQVVGDYADLPELIKNLKIEEIIIAIPSATDKEMRQIVEYCEACRKLGVLYKTVPGLNEIISGRRSPTAIRDIKLEDLINRELVITDQVTVREELQNKTILITGAAGSIGSELVRQIVKFRPGQVILIDRNENNLMYLEKELQEIYPRVNYFTFIADITNESRIRNIFKEFNPDYVFHAAAYKHVGYMEKSLDEAVKNNIYGTYQIAKLSEQYNVIKFVLMSTDKAVRPTSIMG